MFSVIIAGTRTFNDYEFLKERCSFFLKNKKPSEIQIISGGARGADSLGERFAEEKGYALRLMPADWDRYGKSAGYIRNTEMADVADALIAFWDGKSRGTMHMINIARERGLVVRIVCV